MYVGLVRDMFEEGVNVTLCPGWEGLQGVFKSNEGKERVQSQHSGLKLIEKAPPVLIIRTVS